MPVQRCQRDGQQGWKWGDEGYCYIGEDAREKAMRQGRAIEASKEEASNVLLLLVAHSSGPARTEHMAGREYRVVPAVMVRSQVLNNNLGKTYLPAEEINDTWAQMWNGIPVIAGAHPTVQGRAVSARDPHILNEMWAGFVFRAQAQHEAQGIARLAAEVWLDVERAEEVEELANILAKLDQGDPVELSTGFPTAAEMVSGVFNGEEYDHILHPLGTDHLAIFTEKVGACSVEHGCGLGVNEEEESAMAEQEEGVEEEEVTAGEGGVSSEIVELSAPPQDPPSWWKRFTSMVEGFMGGAQNEFDGERRRMVADALRDTYGGPGKYVFIDYMDSVEGVVVFSVENDNDNGESGLFRTTFDIAEGGAVSFADPEQVRRRVEFEPVANEESGTSNRADGGNMEREELITHLEGTGPLERASLEKLTDGQLKALCGCQGENVEGETASTEEAGGEAPAAAQPDSQQDPETEEQEGGEQDEPVAASEATTALLAEVKSLRQEVSGLKEKIAVHDQITAPAIEERERERKSLIEQLSANERCTFTEAQLQAKGLDELRQIEGMVRPTSYAGRGGPKVAASQGQPQYAPPVPYYEQTELKEA